MVLSGNSVRRELVNECSSPETKDEVFLHDILLQANQVGDNPRASSRRQMAVHQPLIPLGPRRFHKKLAGALRGNSPGGIIPWDLVSS